MIGTGELATYDCISWGKNKDLRLVLFVGPKDGKFSLISA